MPARAFWVLLICLLLVGCGRTSDVQAMEDGSYLVAASSTPVWDDPSNANDAAHREAQAYCAMKGLHAVGIASQDSRTETAPSGYSGSSGGSGIFAAASASLNFRCG